MIRDYDCKEWLGLLYKAACVCDASFYPQIARCAVGVVREQLAPREGDKPAFDDRPDFCHDFEDVLGEMRCRLDPEFVDAACWFSALEALGLARIDYLLSFKEEGVIYVDCAMMFARLASQSRSALSLSCAPDDPTKSLAYYGYLAKSVLYAHKAEKMLSEARAVGSCEEECAYAEAEILPLAVFVFEKAGLRELARPRLDLFRRLYAKPEADGVCNEFHLRDLGKYYLGQGERELGGELIRESFDYARASFADVLAAVDAQAPGSQDTVFFAALRDLMSTWRFAQLNLVDRGQDALPELSELDFSESVSLRLRQMGEHKQMGPVEAMYLEAIEEVFTQRLGKDACACVKMAEEQAVFLYNKSLKR